MIHRDQILGTQRGQHCHLGITSSSHPAIIFDPRTKRDPKTGFFSNLSVAAGAPEPFVTGRGAAGEGEKRVGQAVQIHRGGAGVALHGEHTSFGPSADRPGQVQFTGTSRPAGQDERAQWRDGSGSLSGDLFEPADLVVAHMAATVVGDGAGQVRTQVEHLLLDLAEQVDQRVVGRAVHSESDRGAQLIQGPQRLDAGVGLGYPAAVGERGRAVVTGAGRDAVDVDDHRVVTSVVGPAGESASESGGVGKTEPDGSVVAPLAAMADRSDDGGDLSAVPESRSMNAGAHAREPVPVRDGWRDAYGRRWLLETAWALVGFAIGIAGFVFVVTATSTSVGMVITLIGIPMLAVTLWSCGWIGLAHRRLVGVFLDTHVADPPRPDRSSGFVDWLRSTLVDAVNWRAWVYLLLRFPLSTLSFCVTVTVWGLGVSWVVYPVWYRFVEQTGSDGTVHYGNQIAPDVFMDTPAWVVLAVLAGVAVLAVGPWLIHAVSLLDAWLARALLGPTRASQRVRALESTRAAVIEDADVTLRRIERDLHDGTQAQLVALAMQLGMAREELAAADTPEGVAAARRRVDAAHAAAKDALGGLRDIVGGIHPPVLDTGLEPALATLAARSPVPVTVQVDLDDRPDPAIESIAYYSVAELLANVARHSGATAATVTLTATPADRLRVRVGDNGTGGAHPVRSDGPGSGGTGLAGLADRVATVDGDLSITSPPGGPTVVVVELPCRV